VTGSATALVMEDSTDGWRNALDRTRRYNCRFETRRR
jgi:hypothetical protein